MKRFLLLLSLLGLTFIGCRVELDSPAQVSEIGFNKSEVSLTQDDETTIFVKATDNRSLNNLVWSTSPSKQEIVEITKFQNNKASIKALKEGKVTIKVTEEYTGKTANIKINVNAKPITTYSDIIVNADKQTIEQDETLTLKVTTSDNRKLNKINFTINPSNNVSIVENNINGQITLKGVKEGNVVITAKEEVTNKTSKINITVKESPVLKITNLVSYSLLPGEEATFNLVSSDNKAVGDVEISYSTSDIVEVIKTSSNFTIKALKNGKTSITLTETKTGRKVTIPTFTVTDAYINVKDENGYSVSEISLNQNETRTFTYEIKTKTQERKNIDVSYEVSENASKYFVFNLDTSKNTITVTQKETKEIKVPTVTLTLKANLSSSYIAYSNDIKINGTPATYSNIYIMADKNITVGDELIVTVKTDDNRDLKFIDWDITPKNAFSDAGESLNNIIRLKAENNCTATVKATERETGKTATTTIVINKKEIIDNPVENKYRLNIAENNMTINIIPTNFSFSEDYVIDIRAFDNVENAVALTFLKIEGLEEYKDFITFQQADNGFGQSVYKVTLHADKFSDNQEITVRFIASVGQDDITSDFYTFKKITKNVNPPTPTPQPGEGSGQTPGTNNLKPGEALIIKHDYENEVVRWLGGIEEPTEFLDYDSIGQTEWEYDENGDKIPGSEYKSDIKVPKYYVKEVAKNTSSDKPSWYNVIKSYSTDAPDSAMCWAMSASSALHWWFDVLGEEYTNKLFDVRRYRTDLDNTKLLLDDLHASDVHYNLLSSEWNTQEVINRSGIGAYAIKSFGNKGGNPRDLFRLYFFNKETGFQAPKKASPRSLGLLEDKNWDWNWGPGTNRLNHDKLWDYVSIVNHPKDEIVNVFKKAIDDKAAIVLEQANIDDNKTSVDDKTKGAHAIVVWGVIFDKTEENIVGLYIGDNNLKDGNLARVDLVYKQLNTNGGRYYYAAPYVEQNKPTYLKQTSIYALTMLYPPSQNIKDWIDEKAAQLDYPNKSK